MSFPTDMEPARVDVAIQSGTHGKPNGTDGREPGRLPWHSTAQTPSDELQGLGSDTLGDWSRWRKGGAFIPAEVPTISGNESHDSLNIDG